jgi:hypothetical protein
LTSLDPSLSHLYPGASPARAQATRAALARKAAGYPEVTLSLVEALAKAFPDRLPPRGTSLEDVNYLMGQQSVIRELEAILSAQRAPEGGPQRLDTTQ